MTAAPSAPVEMEDDGRPAQIPPSLAAHNLPDDPREPWSRNYGGPAMTAGRAAVPSPKPPTAAVQTAQAAAKPSNQAQQVAFSNDPQ